MTPYRGKDLEAENAQLRTRVSDLEKALVAASEVPEPNVEHATWTDEQRKSAKETMYVVIVITGILSVFGAVVAAANAMYFLIAIPVVVLLTVLWTAVRLNTGHWFFWRGVFNQPGE